MKKTFIGSSIIAMAQNREGANLGGINTNKVAMLTFFLSGSLAALAASLASPINLVFPGMGHLVILKAFGIIILGGMGSIPAPLSAAIFWDSAKAWERRMCRTTTKTLSLLPSSSSF
ncbi:High-affinity branched-chain amino acid transport system permease protein LivH [Geobacillus stearothermophilus]|uniref:High-affinity branched-chain amino acid transport system permease protein LivH n=1 Tax=Geobacillus stearothermophilus TaxID=1422 RepID=A0A150MU44_GEOSE|nr:High-affinity branched-chain amino acid transport system permease protein LivH [Geobacillus stearothermophilus]KYD27978.1 hypothetical protein B4109_1445 [Geobacillus stearothermophilus]